MSEGLTVTYKLERRIPARGTVEKVLNAESDSRSRAKSPPRPRVDPERLARMLALAHFVEQQIEAGTINDYGEAARLLGVSRTRMTQIANLLGLSPTVQQSILVNQHPMTERSIRTVVQQVAWNDQELPGSADQMLHVTG